MQDTSLGVELELAARQRLKARPRHPLGQIGPQAPGEIGQTVLQPVEVAQQGHRHSQLLGPGWIEQQLGAGIGQVVGAQFLLHLDRQGGPEQQLGIDAGPLGVGQQFADRPNGTGKALGSDRHRSRPPPC